MKKDLNLTLVQFGCHILIKTTQIDDRDRGTICIEIPENKVIKVLISSGKTELYYNALYVAGSNVDLDTYVSHKEFSSEEEALAVIDDINRLVKKHNAGDVVIATSEVNIVEL